MDLTNIKQPLGAWPTPLPPSPTSGSFGARPPLPGEPDKAGRPSSPPGAATEGTDRKGAADLTTLNPARGRRRRDRNPDGCRNRAAGAGLRPGLPCERRDPRPRTPCPTQAERTARRHRPAPEPRGGPGGRAGTALTWTRAAPGVSRTSRGGARPAQRLLPRRLRLPPRPGSARLSRSHVPTSRPRAGRQGLWLGARGASARGRHRHRPRGGPGLPNRAGAGSGPPARREPGARPSCGPQLAARTPRPPPLARLPPVRLGPPASPAPGRLEKGKRPDPGARAVMEGVPAWWRTPLASARALMVLLYTSTAPSPSSQPAG